MAYSTTYGYINVPGSSTNYITSGPYSAGAIAVIAERASVNDTKVTISCKVYLGFGSYSASYSSLGTGHTLTGNFWWTLDNQHVTDSCTLKSSSSTWSRTNSTLQRLTTAYSNLTQTAYPDVLSNTSDLVLTFSKWQSGDQIFHFTVTGAKGYQEKTVTVACPTYHADVTISYDANGGSEKPASQTKIYGTDLTLRTEVPTRNGYTFMGWASTNTAKVAEWQPGGVLSAEGARTLYAIWKANTYTITYKANGGAGSMANTTYTYASSGAINLRANTFTKTNYKFYGWHRDQSEASMGDREYENEQAWALSNADNFTLYAAWTPEIYTITLNNDLANNAGTITIYEKYNTGYYSNSTATTPITNITIPSKNNYTFGGYYANAEGTGTQYINSSGRILSNATAFTNNTVLYAKWTLNKKTITYNGNGNTGGTVPTDSTQYNADASIIIAKNELIKTGSSPNGWNTNSNGTGIHYTDEQVYTDSASLILYAEWRANTYTITYNAGEGTGAPSAQTKIYNVNITLSNTVPQRDNYIFVGWAENSVNGQVYSPNGTYTKNNNVTFYAIWETNDFSIDFDSTFLQDYNKNRNQVAFGIPAADDRFNSHSILSQGLYTTGIYVKSKVLDGYGTGVISGQLMAQTVKRAVEKASYSSGIMGSVYIEAPHTDSTPNISAGWYNYIYVPHRNGGNNGVAQSDNCSYGTMIITGMTSDNGIYKIRYNGGIQSVEKFYTTLNKPTASDVNAIPVSDKYTKSSAGHLDWPDNQSSVITKAALAFWNGCCSASDSNLQYSKNGEINRILTYSDSRETSADLVVTGKRGITAILSSSAMTTSRPTGYTGDSAEGTIIHCEWDNNGGWNSQLFIGDNDNANGKPFVAVRGQKSGTWTAWDKLAGSWTQIGTGSNITSKITFSSATTNYNEIMVVASTLRSGGYHLFSGVLPATIIDKTEREFKLSGGTGFSTATNCGAWGKIVTTGFTPVGVWINNTAFSSSTTWYIYGR